LIPVEGKWGEKPRGEVIDGVKVGVGSSC
jgi:hypothetical protein